nr:hypothetical protein [Marinicella sp. W31]MDC2876167.1 hypothetical protein [Marinicella sp. W31]
MKHVIDLEDMLKNSSEEELINFLMILIEDLDEMGALNAVEYFSLRKFFCKAWPFASNALQYLSATAMRPSVQVVSKVAYTVGNYVSGKKCAPSAFSVPGSSEA